MSCGDGQKKSPYSSVYEHSGKRLVGAAIILFFLYLIGKYNISGLPALLLTFGFAFVWESFVVRQGDKGGN